MSTPTSGGAAYNPAVRTEDNAPAPEPDDDCADQRDTSNEADNGQTTGEDGS